VASTKKQTPPTTTPTSPVDPALTGNLGVGAPPAGTTTTNAIPEPTAIGVPKYQTIGGRYVFKGTKYDQLIEGNDGKFYAVDAGGNIIINPDGSPAADTPATDRSGNPVRLPAQYQTPAGTQVPTPGGTTSRIEPGSPAAALGTTGPTRYDEGQEVAILAGMPPEQRAQVQQAMVDRGLAPTNAVGIGGYDSNWASSFKNVLAYANANNMKWDDALRSMPIVDRTSTATVQRNHYNITLTSPTDLRAIFNKAASDLLGGTDVPVGMADGFVNAYQEMQRQYWTAKNAEAEATASEPKQKVTVDADGNPIVDPTLSQQTSRSAGPPDAPTVLPKPVTTTTVNPPTPQAYAQEQLQKQMPGQYRATQIAQQYDVFSKLLGQIGGGGGSTVGTAP
jgi:hypothetical protein